MLSYKFEVINIKFLFWNLYQKNLIDPLVQLIFENDIDVVALVEMKKLDVDALIYQLKIKSQNWVKISICPSTDIIVLCKNRVNINVFVEEKNYCTYKIKNDDDLYLLNVVHLKSSMYCEESARDQRAINISNILRRREEDFFKDSEYKSVIVGDFNLQPYSNGILSAHGFNATMSKHIAQKIKRKVDGENKFFYYNPIWKLMGDNKDVQGTYYSSTDQQDKSIYWYSFDQLLIRPFFIERFNWDNFEIIENTQNHNFINNNKIYKSKYSDHLPIKFEII